MAYPFITRRGFAALAGVAALSALGLSGCSAGEGAQGSAAGSGAGAGAAGDGTTFSTRVESRELMGSPDACDVRVGLIMGRYRLLRSLGGTIVVTGASPRLERMIRLAGLDKLPIWEDQKGGDHHEIGQ